MQSPFLILTANPSRYTLNFADQLARLTDNEIIIISDNQPGEYPSSAKCLYIDDNLAYKNGYFNSSPLIPKTPIAWDKALYCLIENKIEFDYVWIMEDDVLFTSTMVCLELLSKYINSTSDLILPNFFRRTQDPSWSNWTLFAGAESFQIEHQAGGFMPLCRLSRQMIYMAGDFVHEHGSLNFVEVMFPSLAIRHGLKIEIMDFISERRFRWAPAIRKWELMQRWGDNLQTGIFHPVKSEKVRSGASVKPSKWYLAVLKVAGPALEAAHLCQIKVLPYTKTQTRRLRSEAKSRVKNLWSRASN